MYKEITEIGKSFIKRSVNSINIISGLHTNKYSSLDYITFTSTYNINSYSDLIDLFEKYAKEYDLDANIVAANTFEESNFKFWEYSSTGALGISQITRVKWKDVFRSNSILTPEEKELILPSSIFYSEDSISNTDNLVTLHTNICNHPDISIKYQCHILANIAKKSDNLASVALLCYNQGEKFISSDYDVSLLKLQNDPKYSGNYNEGFNHVVKVFNRLTNSFGYQFTKK